MAELFKKISSRNIHLTIYGTKYNQDKMKKFFASCKHITFKCTIPHDDIIKELTRYDYGLCYFNMDYSDAEYIEISQPNKFFDYFYSRLPIICNNTHAFADFINENKTSFAILLFLILYVLVTIMKPAFLFRKNGELRLFGLNYEKKTIIPLWLLVICLAVISYLIILYWLIWPKL